MSARPIRILLQTTIPFVENDWHSGRFSLLKSHLESQVAADGQPRFEVTGRDRHTDDTGSDPLLSELDGSGYDQLWLFAVDTGGGLSEQDCAGITRFRQRGGGILSARDHNDLGSSLCTLGGIGRAHYFHSINRDPDPDRNCRDDNITTNIDYPNYHSGSNGDFHNISPVGEVHELLLRNDGSHIKYFPAHPHEGGVGAPTQDGSARVIATGKSVVTTRDFNLIVAFDHSLDTHGNRLGRALAHSSFHHLADYNWDIDIGCPNFVEESPGDGYKRRPEALDDIKRYVTNAAEWLSQHSAE